MDRLHPLGMGAPCGLPSVYVCMFCVCMYVLCVYVCLCVCCPRRVQKTPTFPLWQCFTLTWTGCTPWVWVHLAGSPLCMYVLCVCMFCVCVCVYLCVCMFVCVCVYLCVCMFVCV